MDQNQPAPVPEEGLSLFPMYSGLIFIFILGVQLFFKHFLIDFESTLSV